jgi:hypothetical protein
MEIKCKERHKWQSEATDRFRGKNWEYFCLASDAWGQGFEKFRAELIADLKKKYDPHTGDYCLSVDHIIELLEKHGTRETTHITDAHAVSCNLWEGRHGQPVQFYKNNTLVSGYWDYVKQREVETLEEVTPLTEHQKTFIREEGKPEPDLGVLPEFANNMGGGGTE